MEIEELKARALLTKKKTTVKMPTGMEISTEGDDDQVEGIVPIMNAMCKKQKAVACMDKDN